MRKLLTVTLAVVMLCTLFSGLGITANASGTITPKVVYSYGHALALNNLGEVFAWGANDKGQLGDGTKNNSDNPVAVSALPDKTFVDVANGISFSLVLADDGQIYSWGNNSHGQLGNGTKTDVDTPTLIAAFAGKTVIKIFAVQYSSAAITSDGKLYVWGMMNNSTTPVEIGGALAGKTVVHYDMGISHAVAVTTEKKAYSFGVNRYGQLGIGTTVDQGNPVEITSVSNVVDIAVGENHTMLLTEDGEVYSCGLNNFGQLGNGRVDEETNPDDITANPVFAKIEFPAGVAVKQISAIKDQSAMLGTNGKVYRWGQAARINTTPTEYSGLSNIVSISVSKAMNLMSIDDTGAVFMNTNRIVGVGGTGFLSLGTTNTVTETHDVTGDYVTGTEGVAVYSVDITWGSFEFTYTDGNAGTWNPDTLQYSGGSEGQWSCAENANRITVVNKSNTAITAQLSFAASITGISGGFFTATTGGTAIAENTLSVESAAPVAPATVGTAKTAEAYLQITAGSLTAGQTDVTLGTVTVTVN